MTTTYRLEAWVTPQQWTKVRPIAAAPVSANPRSILTLYLLEIQEEPATHQVHDMLEWLEGQADGLDAAGLGREALSLWVECAYESGESCTFSFDAWTLLRLAELEVKPCVSAWQAQPEVQVSHDPGVGIQETWIVPQPGKESLFPAVAQVLVALDDSTHWEAPFSTFSHLCQLMQETRMQRDPASQAWRPHGILVPEISVERAEEVITELLEQQNFERVFRPLGHETYDPKDLEETNLELCMVHNSRLPVPVETLLPPLSGTVLAGRHRWRLRRVQLPSQPPVYNLHYFLDLLEGAYGPLAAAGIQRKDISIHWEARHRGRCHLEFRPEELDRLGKNGIGLELCLREAYPSALARSA
jgi:hypothetical protein